MQDYEGVRVAVLGSSGFIGWWVARRLHARGAKLFLLVRDQSSASKRLDIEGIRGEVIAADVSNGAQLAEIYGRIRPAITFNLTGYGVDASERDERIAYRLNSEAVRTLCQVVDSWKDPSWDGQHLVHAGSAAEYGSVTGDLREDGPVQPMTLYGKSKLQGTQVLVESCRSLGLRGVTGRLFTVYGPGEHAGRLLPSLIESSRTGAPLKLTSGVQSRDFTYVEDACEGLLRLGLTATTGGTVANVATGKLTAIRTFAETAAGILRIPKENLQFGVIPIRGDEMQHDPASVYRLGQLTHWKPDTSVADGIRKSVEVHLQRQDERQSYADRSGVTS